MRKPWSLILAPLLLAACTDRSGEPVGPQHTPLASTLAQLSQEETPDQMAVARVVPGFAGYFLAADRPTVYLTDASQRPAAEEALAGWLSSRGFAAPDLQVRQAQYDWIQLDAWHEQAWPEALSVSGAVLSDIDEGSNRLRFGGVDASAVTAMAAAVADAGVPSDAYVVEQVPAVVLLNTLRDRVRPVPGGYQINFFATPSAVTLVCTLGFNAIPEGPPFAPNPSFVTNSHCSNTEGDGALNATDYYQPLRGGLTVIEENFIGTEVDDPFANISADCPDALPCRWSDAARAEYAAGVPFELGKIARPAAFDPVLGTLEVDPKKPTFEIVDEQPFAVLGETANKVGRTTGWTGGEIIATCQNILAIGATYVRRCQARVAAGAAGGDSGSPVFAATNRRTIPNSGKVIFSGILWAGAIDGSSWIYSPTFNIERDLGLLQTH